MNEGTREKPGSRGRVASTTQPPHGTPLDGACSVPRVSPCGVISVWVTAPSEGRSENSQRAWCSRRSGVIGSGKAGWGQWDPGYLGPRCELLGCGSRRELSWRCHPQRGMMLLCPYHQERVDDLEERVMAHA